MQLFWIDLIGFILILVGLILFAAKKIKLEKSFLIILYLTMLPPVVYKISYSLTETLFNGFNHGRLNFGHLILLFLFFIEFVIASLFIIIRYNAFPKASLPNEDNLEKKLISVYKARKILNWACYSYIVNLLFCIPIVLVILFGAAFVNMFLVGLPGAIIILIPIDAYLYIIVTFSLCIVFGVTFIFIINGTLRLLFKSKFSTEHKVLYILLMLIPLVNLILSFVLRNKAKKILRSDGIKVGMFGVTMLDEN